MFADEIRRQAEGSPRAALPAVAAALWRAYGESRVSEAQAEALAAYIAERQRAAQDQHELPREGEAAPVAAAAIVRRYGSRPRTGESMARRRRWAASGRLPPRLADRFTLGEVAVLAVVAAEVAKRGDCRLHLDHLAAVAGVGRTTTKNALREAQALGLVRVEERRLTAWRSDSNIVRVVSPEWQSWMRLARRETRFSEPGGGVKSATTTPTSNPESGTSRCTRPALKGCRGPAVGVPPRSTPDSARRDEPWRPARGGELRR